MISVQILIFHITGQRSKSLTMIRNATFFSFQRSIIGSLFFGKETIVHISELLPDRTTCPTHPFIRLRNFIVEHNLILGISPIGSNMISYILNLVFPASRHFETFIINFTHIYDRQTYGEIAWIDITGDQNVFTVFNEVIERRFQATVKKV